MNWLLLTLIASSAICSFLAGWTVCRTVTRFDARADAIRANLRRPTDKPGNYGAWRYRR